MSNEYLQLNDTQLNIKKSENLIAIIEEKRKDAIDRKEIQSENSLFSELFKAFKDFFSKLGKPNVQKRLQKTGSPARSSDYNTTMREIHDDIHVAYAETDALSSVIVKDFNYSESERQMLLNKVKLLSSNSTDYSFYSQGAKSQSIFGVDSFTSNSKVDFSKIGPGAQAAELVTNQGVVTLKRTGNVDRNPLVSTVTGIQESIPTWNAASETGGYEGLYFGVRNEPRPEGGQWHITYSADGSRLFENGASEEENMPRRLQMFDNNPDTFWEVEYITSPIVGYINSEGNQISVSEFNSLVNNDVNSPDAENIGGTIVTNQHGSLVESYSPVSSTGTIPYLTCSFIVFLSRSEVLNWVSLNPNNFGQENYMEIISIQTSSDGKAFDTLDGFDDHEFETMLTAQANSELTPAEVSDTLSPDQFKFAGQGVWVFAPRQTKAIKFDLRQTRSYLKTYEVLMVELEQTITTTVNVNTPESGMWWWHKDATSTTTTSSRTVQNQVEIPYLTGHVVGFDVMSLEQGGVSAGTTATSGVNAGNQVAGSLVGGTIGFATGAWAGATAGAAIGGWGGPIGAAAGFVIGGLIGWLFGSSSSAGSSTTSTTTSPQRMTRQWTKAKNDRARFALGVRDINLYSYKFAATSEIVSKPYMSPSPVAKIALQVEEQIPKVFYSDASRAGSENDWIKYYVSVDNGTSWIRISPTHHKTTVTEDGKGIVPEILNVNSDVPIAERSNPLAYVDVGDAVYSVRFKAALSRPTDIADAESYTPVLSQYSLQIYPAGGL